MTRDDTTLIFSSGNVFVDLGFAKPDASVHKMRSERMIADEKMLEEIRVSDAG